MSLHNRLCKKFFKFFRPELSTTAVRPITLAEVTQAAGISAVYHHTPRGLVKRIGRTGHPVPPSAISSPPRLPVFYPPPRSLEPVWPNLPRHRGRAATAPAPPIIVAVSIRGLRIFATRVKRNSRLIEFSKGAPEPIRAQAGSCIRAHQNSLFPRRRAFPWRSTPDDRYHR